MNTNSPVEIGALIAGKYRVERVLGQGGMGVVVVAMHDELDQRVAIKFLLPEALRDADWVARFARESRAAARIKSEHAVKVYDVGKLDTGAPYMVMEYLEGRDLQTILNDRQRLPVAEAVDFLLQASEAIAEAHAAGIVHRDLKPANLFVTHRTDGSSCVKILDFGISKVSSLTGSGTRDQTMTNTSAIVGSPLYMSPEQMKASKNVDRRTDIWSLGVILQELVTGSPSFVANTTAELCALVLTSAPVPLRDSLPDAPAGLERVLERCLAKRPEDRFADVSELANALASFGPASVSTSVERIGRLSASRPNATPSISNEPSPVSIVPAGAGQTNLSLLGQTELSGPMSTPLKPAIEPVVNVAATAAAWGSSPSTTTRRSRAPIFIGAGAAVFVLGVIGVYAIARAPHTPAVTTATETAHAEPSVTHVTTSEPVITTAGVAVAIPTATTTTTTATATASTTTAAIKPSTTNTVKPTTTTSSVRKPTGAAPVDTSGFGGRN